MAYKGNKNNSESTYFHNTFDIDKFLNCFEEDDEFFRSIKRYRASYKDTPLLHISVKRQSKYFILLGFYSQFAKVERHTVINSYRFLRKLGTLTHRDL